MRYFTDIDGEKVELSDHEGWVPVELVASWSYGYVDDETGTFWTGTSASDRPAVTGRCRAACECGWRGPIVTGVATNAYGDPTVSEQDRVMAPWSTHADEMVGLARVASAADAERGATETLFGAVRTARHGGHTWAAIATMLGVTRQSAWQRFRSTDDADAGADS